MNKLFALLLTLCSICVVENYLDNKVKVLQNDFLQNNLKKDQLNSVMQKVHLLDENISFLKKRFSFLKQFDNNDILGFIKLIAELKDIKILDLTFKNDIISISYSSSEESKVLAFLKMIFYKSPFWANLNFLDIREENGYFVGKILGECYSLNTQKTAISKIAKSKGFSIMNNYIAPKCIVSNDVEKTVLIDNVWFKKNQKYKRFLVLDINNNEIVVYDPILNKQFILNVGEKNIICP